MLDTSIVKKLTSEDDPRLWDLAITTVLTEAERSCDDVRDKVLVQIGCCRHWISPHHPIRWAADGGFAWPFGYDKTTTGWSYRALPELEWSRWFRWTGEGWVPGRTGARCLLLRMAIPARTARHSQAAIHTIWTPRSPKGKEKVVQLYGFRKVADMWFLTANEILRPRKK